MQAKKKAKSDKKVLARAKALDAVLNPGGNGAQAVIDLAKGYAEKHPVTMSRNAMESPPAESIEHSRREPLISALLDVVSGRYRRTEVDWKDRTVQIYRCANDIVRADFHPAKRKG